ncbi:hypothetical protein Tco_0451157 [Tanacetum coccineum]
MGTKHSSSQRHKGNILLVLIFVDVHYLGIYKKELCDEFVKLMKDLLMYLTAFQADIMFAVCAEQWFQDSPLELVAYTDSDYAGATQDRKSTTGGSRDYFSHDGHSMTITEGSLRRHLKLDDQDGLSSIPNSEIFEQLELMGYHTYSDKLTFQKGAFSPQWRIGVLEDDLKTTKQTYSSAFTKLILRVKKLEAQIKIGKARRRAKIVHSDDEDIADDSSKQGRILSDAEVQEKASNETEPVIQDVTPTEVIQDQESSEKGSAEVSTAGAKKGTASEEVPIVSTAEVNLSTAGGTVTYSRRSEEQRKRKDKGKAIMTESEPKKKSKKELEQERLSFAEAIRLEEQMNEEQRAQIARDEEIARQWDEEERQRAMSEAKTSKKIDWNDPSVISDFKGMSYNEIRPIFEKVWDFNQHIEPMDSEHGSEIMKSPEKIKSAEKIKEGLDEEQVSSDDNEVTKVKALMALTDEERVFVGKESANNDYLCIDLNYVEEQRNNLLSKQRSLVHELNTCKEQLLVLKQAKLDLLTMQHVNTEILKENQNLKNELKELTSITEAWLNNSNKVNQNKPKLSEVEDFTLSDHDTVCSTPLPLLEKLTGAEPVSGPKTIKSILKSKSTFKAETLKGITISKHSSAPARGNKSSSASKTNSAHAGKLKNVKIEDDPPLSIVIKELNELKLQFSKNKSSYFRNKNSQQLYDTHDYNKIISLRRGIKPRNPQHITKNCETCGSNVYTTSDHNDIEWFRKRESLQAKKVESFKASKTESSSALRSKTPTKSTFLNDKLKEEAYVKQPPGFEIK